LSRKDFDALEVYYRELEELLDMKPPVPEGQAQERVLTEAKNRIHNLEGLQVLASQALEKYNNPSWRERVFGL
jgi:hypothetical protein